MTFAERILTALAGKTWLFSAGQAGFIIKSRSGQLLGIDLYLSDCVERVEGNIGYKRLIPKLLSPAELQFDYLITTHPHLDHFDLDSVPELMSNSRTQLYASVRCREMMDRLYMKGDRTIYVKPGDSYHAGDFNIHFVNCDHGAGAPDAVGVIVEVDGILLYETGDTCLRLDRVDEARQFGRIDYLIAPINGAFGNLNEEDCVRLVGELNPGKVIPCHYGMFASHGGSPGRLYELMKEHGYEQKLQLMCPGEGIRLSTEGEGMKIHE